MIYYGKQKAIEYLEDILLKHGKVEVSKVKEMKTLSQVKYAWLCFTHVSEETGEDKDSIYNFCLNKFGIRKECSYKGEVEEYVLTLSGMDKDQCSNFIDKFVIFFRQEGIDLPDPETQRAKEMYFYYKEKGMI